jgi:hypothetical protein
VNYPKLAPFRLFLWVSIVLCLIGYSGLVLLLFYTLPTLGPRWLFYFLLTLALTGTALPLVYLFNRRFPSTPPAESSVILREAMWFGVFGSLAAWLRQGGVYTSGLALVLAAGLVLVEFLLRLSERSQWSPERFAEHPPEDNGDEEDEEDFEEEDD